MTLEYDFHTLAIFLEIEAPRTSVLAMSEYIAPMVSMIAISVALTLVAGRGLNKSPARQRCR